ncbi:hypothetical protein ACN47E_000956 [Coniothyrium glycines]
MVDEHKPEFQKSSVPQGNLAIRQRAILPARNGSPQQNDPSRATIHKEKAVCGQFRGAAILIVGIVSFPITGNEVVARIGHDGRIQNCAHSRRTTRPSSRKAKPSPQSNLIVNTFV